MPSTKIILVTVFTLLYKAVFAKWASQKAVAGFNWLIVNYLIKYPREWTIWQHYHKKKQGQGHQYPNPVICNEEDCRAI